MARIVLGVCGGIAAYKACELLRLATEAGHQVRVVPTESALRFVGAATWQALSGQPLATDVWTDAHQVPHVRLGQGADLVLVAPATADLLARAATGRADDLLTNVLLTVRCPVLFAPAMHTEMWQHPATVDNVAVLRRRGAIVIDPASGRLTGPDSGPGRLPEPAEIWALATRVLARGGAGMVAAGGADLAGRRVVVTAGGTREPLDPVRYLGNRSSGRQGYALARSAVARGAAVRLIAANVSLPDPAGAEVVHVGSTEELREETLAAAAAADIVVMAAAPADYRPSEYAPQKIKASAARAGEAMQLRLVATPDIAAELGAAKRPGQVLVVFAAETATGADALATARDKLARKGADLIVLNDVSGGRAFGAPTNAATVITVDGSTTVLPEQPKDDLADSVWDLVKTLPGDAA